MRVYFSHARAARLFSIPPQAPVNFLLRREPFHRGEHTSSIRKRDRVARSVERSVFRAEALDDDLVARFECGAAHAAALEHTWRAARESPVRDGAVGILHVDVEPDMRVAPLDTRHDAANLHRLFEIVF